MIFAHGNKVIALSIFLVTITLTTLLGLKITEKKIELKKNIKRWEIISMQMENNNEKVKRDLEK